MHLGYVTTKGGGRGRSCESSITLQEDDLMPLQMNFFYYSRIR